MATYVLGNDVLFGTPPSTLRAGKVIDDRQYNVVLLAAAGALLFPNTNASVAARSSLLQARDKRGRHGMNVDQGSKTDSVGDFAQPTTPATLIRFPIGLVSASSAASIPAAAIVVKVALDIRVAYTGGTTIALGQGGSTSLFAAAGTLVATSTGVKPIDIDVALADGLAIAPVLATVAGGPVAGSGFVLVWFSQSFA